jgi:cytochrome c-type biogenesis protein CcmH/NrfG
MMPPMPESQRPSTKAPSKPTAVRSPGAAGKTAAPPPGRGARRPPGQPRRSSGDRARLTFAVLGVIVVLSMTFGLVAVGSSFNFGQGGGQDGAPSPSPGSNLVPTYEARLRDNPNDVNTMVVLANVLQNQGDYQGAINWYEKAVGLKPDDIDLRLAFGQALYSYGQLFDAEVQYKKAIELDGKNARAEYYLAQLYQRSNPPRIEEARIHFTRASELEPEGSWGRAARSALDSLNATPVPATATP